ncbi:PQQ-dependent sugar dehydrogenase [Mongoliibacter ruber]|uniref:Glucose/arabinose dehydrogenase n=1 Tax=Mongoliibacter ruber TaxID=1750599 RepID=A0A2T0WEJ3_9BACT|nr:PQQ-dependent sugar dehydrogenase [Mongoliibacter ruber]PRY85133.1 glucose/arabinose dehydrogenase [Mongoliibacter ruber]
MNRILIFVCSISILACSMPEKEGLGHKVIGYIQLENSILEITEVIDSLTVPWDIETARSGELWFTEVAGNVYRYDLETGEKKHVLTVSDILAKKSYGLLGMTVHPEKNYVFIHYTFAIPREGMDEKVSSRLVRYEIGKDTLTNPRILLDSLPGATFHNGSRLVIGSDDKLYFSLGDVGKTDRTQDLDFLGGKVLRIELDGGIPEDNPYPKNPVWAMGLRNTQGLVFGKNNQLYGSDHGPLNDDEVNLLVKGGNYGWPDVQGFADSEEEKTYQKEHQTIDPLKAWTPTIATAGISYLKKGIIPEWDNSLLLVSMKGMSLRVLHLNDEGTAITEEGIYLQKYFGRLRDVSIAENGDIFISTSNRDWHPRFQPWMYPELPEGPDKILKIRILQAENAINHILPIFQKEKETMVLMDENWSFEVSEDLEKGAQLYTQHCLTCHGPDGKGAEGLIPPLAATEWVTGDKGRLIRVMLQGLSEEITVNGLDYHQEMPSYRHLSDEEIAEILTFIRNSFGNNAGAVIPGEVFEERKAL